MTASRLSRTRSELSEFLRRKRAAIRPEEVGLPIGTRRRTPGLRREEVATLAGVGLSWYTWLEQGREISVSSAFLDNVARALKMDGDERKHLYLLAQQRPPSAPAKTWCVLPPLVRRLLEDLPVRPSFVMNLRWDVIGWNAAADRVFGFDARPAEHRNMLWMYFSDDRLSGRVENWPHQAPQIVASFRRDFAQAVERPDMQELVERLQSVSSQFRHLWADHRVNGSCEGQRSFNIEAVGRVTFSHSTFVVDQDRHLRLVFYAAVEGDLMSAQFEQVFLGEGANAHTAPKMRFIAS
ncbi:helix-turn-helix domain-containing protein [Pseudooceanicola spongiae]|uniref:Helix-turn-helix domain-containing protein n=1 Tax=Pseudooceanicola spongiae TaxID=2613965 RepID=A0A7L9WTD6_9RHOB|nr:helix-turn-helix domain-containing protein [Pseudooceanicola spongiae]